MNWTLSGCNTHTHTRAQSGSLIHAIDNVCVWCFISSKTMAWTWLGSKNNGHTMNQRQLCTTIWKLKSNQLLRCDTSTRQQQQHISYAKQIMQFTWTTSNFNNNRGSGINAILIRYQRRINEEMDGKLYGKRRNSHKSAICFGTLQLIE